jgi:hypothetical protein
MVPIKDSNHQRIIENILEELKTKRVTTIDFESIAFSHNRIALNASIESFVYVSTTVIIIDTRRSKKPLNI